MKDFLINSIYRATEGEGVNIGQAQVFVRFQGCAVGCLNCDSMDTWDFDPSTVMTLSEVMASVEYQGHMGKIKRVSITGGDPLHPKHTPRVLELVKELKLKGYWVNIEAAGTRIVDELFDLIDFISFDFKTPSTGVATNPQLIRRVLEQYGNRAQIKSVIETKADFSAALLAHQWLLENTDIYLTPWVLTPSYNLGEEFPEKRFQDVMLWNEEAGAPFRVIGQQHKWIFGPDKKQV